MVEAETEKASSMQRSKDPRNPNLAASRDAVMSKIADSGSCIASSMETSVWRRETELCTWLPFTDNQDRTFSIDPPKILFTKDSVI